MAPKVGFGWLKVEDPRDEKYPMKLLLQPLQQQFFPRGVPEGKYHYGTGPILAQGQTGTCVGHGCTSYVHAAPIKQKLPITPFQLYRRIIAVDEFRGNDHEINGPDTGLQYGTSSRAGLEVLKEMGYIKSYLWAQELEDIRGWLLSRLGCVTAGTVWKSDMMNTDSDGFINYTGTEEGGHFYLLKGWSDRVKKAGRYVRAARIQQSWGKPWGHGGTGFAWMSEDDVAKALEDWGEFAAPTEIRVKV